MRFHSSVSQQEDSRQAVDEVIAAARAETDGKVDVVFAFLTAQHHDDAEMMLERLWLELDPQAVVGCSAEGVIGGESEIESGPGLAVLAARLGPGVRVHPFHIGSDDWRGLLGDQDELRQRLGAGAETRAIIGLGDPFTTPVNQLLPAIDSACLDAPLVGGMASSARKPGGNVLLRNDQIFDDGFVGVSLSGAIEVQTVVSQGCRPIGKPMLVTKARENVIEQLGGRAALGVLRETVSELPESEQDLLQHGLFVGQAISEYRQSWNRGDFLVRNIIGADEQVGSLAVADYVRVGQTVQFHVRDASTADEDLSLMLQPQAQAPSQAAGALLFSCNGRGTRLFDQPCHDVGLSRRMMPRTPVAGFFAAGELGPVGRRNFIHGHTASFALFRPKQA
ncbi:MAG: FIST signal transduction protein [Tepidisphaeraceae bacterium]